MSYNNKKMIVSVICRSPGQSADKFDTFLSDFENFFEWHKQM